MRLVYKDWVCTASENEVQTARRRWQAASGGAGRVCDPLWRQIQVLGTRKTLLLELFSVSEATAHSPAADVAPVDAMKYGFTWEDLDDCEFLCKILAHEQFIVGTKVLRILDSLKKNQDILKERLTSHRG